MGKAVIREHIGAGLYRVDIYTDSDGLDARVAALNEQIAALFADITDMEARLAELLASAKADPLNAGILGQLYGLRYDLGRAKIRKSALTLERDRLASIPSLIEGRQIWCADLSEELSGDVALLEMAGDLDAGVVIRPGHADGAAHDMPRDGIWQHSAATSAWRNFYHLSILPGHQKYKPRARIGAVTAVNDAADTVDVTLDATPSRYECDGWSWGPGNIDLNQTPTLSSVPVVYMACNAAPYEIGDRVIVEWPTRDWAEPRVIGFESNPKPCGHPYYIRTLIDGDPAAAGRTMKVEYFGHPDTPLMPIDSLGFSGPYNAPADIVDLHAWPMLDGGMRAENTLLYSPMQIIERDGQEFECYTASYSALYIIIYIQLDICPRPHFVIINLLTLEPVTPADGVTIRAHDGVSFYTPAGSPWTDATDPAPPIPVDAVTLGLLDGSQPSWSPDEYNGAHDPGYALNFGEETFPHSPQALLPAWDAVPGTETTHPMIAGPIPDGQPVTDIVTITQRVYGYDECYIGGGRDVAQTCHWLSGPDALPPSVWGWDGVTIWLEDGPRSARWRRTFARMSQTSENERHSSTLFGTCPGPYSAAADVSREETYGLATQSGVVGEWARTYTGSTYDEDGDASDTRAGTASGNGMILHSAGFWGSGYLSIGLVLRETRDLTADPLNIADGRGTWHTGGAALSGYDAQIVTCPTLAAKTGGNIADYGHNPIIDTIIDDLIRGHYADRSDGLFYPSDAKCDAYSGSVIGPPLNGGRLGIYAYYPAPGCVDLDPMIAELIELHNAHRVSIGEGTLTCHRRLCGSASRHAKDMAVNQWIIDGTVSEEMAFKHIGSDGTAPIERIKEAGYYLDWDTQNGLVITGENVARFADYYTPAEMLQVWLDSPPHREVLEHPELRDIGIGIVYEWATTAQMWSRFVVVNFGYIETRHG